MFWVSIGQVLSEYGQGTVTPKKYVHTVSVVFTLSCSLINPLTCTLNSPNGLSWTNITPLYNVHVFCVCFVWFSMFLIIYFINSFMIFHKFSKFFMFKIEKLLGFGRFIFTIFKNKNINPVSVTYPISNMNRAYHTCTVVQVRTNFVMLQVGMIS